MDTEAATVMRGKLYLETSVLSYYTARPSRDLIIAARQETTREIWPKLEEEFDRYISALVIQEASQGDLSAAKERLAAVSALPILQIESSAEELAEVLVSRGPIPARRAEDALHIALCATNGIDFLLTWNFAHINNARLRTQVARIVETEGYECPVLCSPDELME